MEKLRQARPTFPSPAQFKKNVDPMRYNEMQDQSFLASIKLGEKNGAQKFETRKVEKKLKLQNLSNSLDRRCFAKKSFYFVLWKVKKLNVQWEEFTIWQLGLVRWF